MCVSIWTGFEPVLTAWLSGVYCFLNLVMFQVKKNLLICFKDEIDVNGAWLIVF